MRNSNEFDKTLLPFTTLICAAPVTARSWAGMVATSCDATIWVEARVTPGWPGPLHCTVDRGAIFCPVMVTVAAAEPAVAAPGDREIRVAGVVIAGPTPASEYMRGYLPCGERVVPQSHVVDPAQEITSAEDRAGADLEGARFVGKRSYSVAGNQRSIPVDSPRAGGCVQTWLRSCATGPPESRREGV